MRAWSSKRPKNAASAGFAGRRPVWYIRRMTNIVLRQRQPTIMTRALKKRWKLSRWEKVRIYVPAWSFFVCLGALVLAIVWQANSHEWVPVSTFMIVVSILVGGAHFIWWSEMDAGRSLKMRERREQVVLDRQRRYRAHRDVEKTRLRELKYAYTRYSVHIQRSGSDVALRIVAHDRRDNARIPWGNPWIPWNAQVSKKRPDQQGTYTSSAIHTGMVSDPTLESVATALVAYEEKAMELENKSYDEALKHHMVDALTAVVQPPMMAQRHQTHVERLDPRIQTVLADYERLRREDP